MPSDKYIEANATRVNGQIAEDRNGNRKTKFLDFKESHDINSSGNGREFNQFLDEAAKAKKQNPNAANGPLVTTGDFNEFVKNRDSATAELGQPGKEAMTKKAHASVASGQPLETFNDATDSKKDRAKALQPDPQQPAKPQTKGGKKTADNDLSETPAAETQTAVASATPATPSAPTVTAASASPAAPAPISSEVASQARAHMASLQSGGTNLTQDSSVVGQANAPAARVPQPQQSPAAQLA